MLNKRIGWKILGLTLLAGSVWILGCNSSGTGGGGPADSGSQFVASADQVGTISLTVKRNPLGVAETSPFSVYVRDQKGDPVSQIRISCDSEREIAIIEPTMGVEMTDSYGHMSGVVGCVAPGSFQLGCRLPVGANKRAFVTIHCVGEVPAGFTGWPGAAGGSLGGGVDTTGDDEGIFAVRITGIAFIDTGGTATTNTIDVVQITCPDGSPEPFYDTQIKITVVNNSNEDVEFNEYKYEVPNYKGGATFESNRLSISGGPIASGGGEKTLTALFLRASGGRKYYYKNELITSSMQGFKNVKVTLYGTNSEGEAVSISARTSMSLGSYDRCPSGGGSTTTTTTTSTTTTVAPATQNGGGGGGVAGISR